MQTVELTNEPRFFNEVGTQDIIVTGTLVGDIVIEQLAPISGGWAPISGGTFSEPGSRTIIPAPHGRTLRATGDLTNATVEITR